MVLLLLASRSPAQQPSVHFPAGTDLGLIFSTRDLLLGLEEYQGGLGLKIAGDEMAYRVLFDVFFSSVNDSYAVALGLAAERHLLMTGRVSPYAGAALTLEAARTSTTDVNTGIERDTLSLPVSLGAMFGVEVFVFRFLSIFAEYSISATLQYNTITETLSGTRSTDRTWDWSVDAGMGNQARIGVVLYFSVRRELDLSGSPGQQQTARK
jgi:hypothetical protein